VFGRPCWPSLDAVPADEIDVACLLVGPEDTISALEAATSKTIGYVVIWSPGFAEVDDGNSELQTRLMDIARRGGMRIYGPNSPGTSNFLQQITLTPSGVHRLTTRPGPVGAATQGGGLGRNILQNLHARTGV